MDRSSNGASSGADKARLLAQARLDRLMATALVQALTPSLEPGPAASHLADLADGRLRALDQARSQFLRNEDGRPTNVTSTAAASLVRARSVVAGRLQDGSDGNGSADG